MKKITVIIGSFALLLCMAGCGKESTSSQIDSTPVVESDYINIDDIEVDSSVTSSSEIDTADKSSDEMKTPSVNYTSKVASSAYAHSHYYTSKITKEASCGEEGIKTFTCSCGASYTEVIPANDYRHSWESATCTEPKKCKVCGKTEGKANGHNYNSSHKCYSCGEMDPEVNETLSKCSLELPALPQAVSYYSYGNKLHSSVEVTAISYEFEYYRDGKVTLTAKFSGTKTYDYRGPGQSDDVKIGWKLYDPNGNVFRTGTFNSPNIAEGESFTSKEDDLIYNFEATDPGKFKLVLSNVN